MSWPVVSLARAHALLTAPGSPFEIEEVTIRGVPTRVWKHAPPTLREAFVAARAAHGPKTFLVYEDERTTYEGFARAAIVVAHALRQAGVVKGDRVAIAMRNLPEWPVAFYGALLAGAIATPLNAWWTAGELVYGLEDSGARVLIADGERFERLRGRLSSCGALERVWVARASGDLGKPSAARFEDLVGPVDGWAALPEQALPDVPLQPEDDATIFYTSGTTGNSKGALGTHRNATCILGTGAFSVLRNCLRRGDPLPQPDPNAPQKAALLSVPFFHVTGCHAVLNGTLHTGGKLVLMHHWDPERAMQLIERERVTSAGGVPTIAWQIIEHPARPKYDLSSLESMAYGGAPAAPELVRRIREVFPTSAPGIGWGMSETSSTFTGHSAEDYVHRPDSSGPALPVCDMKVVAPDGSTLPAGEVGELWVRGPNVVRGYWNKPEATAATFVDGWLRTGDLARLDDEGFVFIVDRMKDMIIRGGENIYCIEVEDALYRHPAVMDAALIGLPHHSLGEEPAAVVALKPGAQATEAELRAHVAGLLAAFKVPVRIVFQPGTLPRNANGKIMKKDLKALFQ
ncbi:MAG TPA: class I adenylate-forming enzyme family protein [Quisquiliibacterium sp.]|nr:class I adenylate-forming enzyme family protein [Quisquiliibacterium sp.]HQD82578.1 class I adenylate-forming enzyme family protein [Quisquiliibacterium sp.]HQN13634.1 class I adenylate-forming enzyme family protein [Quisquiliibacterium sp.]HQP65041.1 class I adenylate-forming enzyme family protein [Quisquiliibacterium sp.]